MDNRLKEDDKAAHRTPSQKWTVFIENTTLHGIRNVVPSQKPFLRLLWLILLLASSTYFSYTVYLAITKYFEHSIVTVISRTYQNNMTFPAVTICPNNVASRAKILMKDEDPRFTAQGLNISACAATKDLRKKEMNNMPCGLAMLCCCAYYGFKSNVTEYTNCTEEKRSALRKAIKKSGTSFNMEDFFLSYSHDLNTLVMFSWCTFRYASYCTSSDFLPEITETALCYTFNSGKNNKTSKVVQSSGVTGGLALMLNINEADYMAGTYSQGFTISFHGQGEFFNAWDAFSVSPGTYTSIALSEQRFENLESPYGQHCKTISLKSQSKYTTAGCHYECVAERYIRNCHCRPAGYTGSMDGDVCSQKDVDCLRENEKDLEKCDCPTPCFLTNYQVEISYSKFPDRSASSMLYHLYDNMLEQSNNLAFLQVGFKSLSYEEQKQKPAYELNSLFGEIGGNMGLLLGCSVLTLCEFIEFLCSLVAAKWHNRNVTPASSLR